MTQREIDKRVGLKGRTRQFTFPVSESKFSGDRVMFNDTGSVTQVILLIIKMVFQP